jgi:hypothetical protein
LEKDVMGALLFIDEHVTIVLESLLCTAYRLDQSIIPRKKRNKGYSTRKRLTASYE